MKMPPWLQIDAAKANAGVEMPEASAATGFVRSAFKLRMSLIPYFYAAFNGYHQTGLPPVRALVLDYPNDPHTAKIDDQFMFGPSLMAAPMIDGTSKRSVYFPAGDWFDFFTGEKIVGGHRIDISKGLDQMPLYVKSDCLLPLAEPVNHVDSGTTFKVHVRVYGSHPTPFTLYEDDGETFDFEKGAQSRVVLTWDGVKGATQRSGSFTPVRNEIVSWETIGS
jgi:alpha-D-xyloside xylohydrolase